VENPFLRHVGYKPAEEPAILRPPLSASAPALPVAPALAPVRRSRARRFMGLFLAALLGASLEQGWDFFTARVRDVLHVYKPQPTLVPNNELGGIVIERYPSLALALAAEPELAPIINNLNGSSVHRFNVPVSRQTADSARVYSIHKRSGFEVAYQELFDRGLNDLKLYELQIPSAWTVDKLDANKYRWAHWCRVDPLLIDRWSEFRSGRPRKRVNECRPGGRCVIVSYGCNPRILTEINAEE
jgi:hypothetical protein